MQVRKIVTALGVVALAVSGCGTEVKGQPAGDPATTSPAPETTSPAEPPPAGGDGKPTPTGTTLAVGQTATVKWEPAGTKKVTTLEIAATEVRKGAIADLKNFQLDAQTKAGEPFYVTMKFTNKGPGETTTSGVFGIIEAHNGGGDELPRLSLLGTFDKCDDSPPDNLAVDASYTACQVYIAPAGQDVATVVYSTYAEQEKQEVTWKAG